jgi:hypothetical protein
MTPVSIKASHQGESPLCTENPDSGTRASVKVCMTLLKNRSKRGGVRANAKRIGCDSLYLSPRCRMSLCRLRGGERDDKHPAPVLLPDEARL